MYDKILIANDGSPGGAKALEGAIALAKRLGVGLTMVCVEDVERFPAIIDVVPEAQRDHASPFEPVVQSAEESAKANGVPLKAHILTGHPVQRIAELIEDGGFDLLVVGYSGHSALYERLIGSTADRLVSLARCTVMVVR